MPEYMSTGIFESKLLSDIQEQLPSVVVYFWNLSGGKNVEKTIDTYCTEYKKNQ